MTLVINQVKTLPPAVNEAYVITRPAGAVPATSAMDTNTISFDYFDIGSLGVAPKVVSFHVTPNVNSGGHCGIACNLVGTQTITPPVFGAGINFWTHGNGVYFHDNLNIYVESWHINPGSSQAAGDWLDDMIVGTWVKGHTYQVDFTLYVDGSYTIHVQDLAYLLSGGKPNPNAMPKFYTTDASASDLDLTVRIRAKSVGGRTNKMAVFHAGVGTGMTVTPKAIFN